MARWSTSHKISSTGIFGIRTWKFAMTFEKHWPPNWTTRSLLWQPSASEVSSTRKSTKRVATNREDMAAVVTVAGAGVDRPHDRESWSQQRPRYSRRIEEFHRQSDNRRMFGNGRA